MNEFKKDLLDFIGRQIVVAMREIKPVLMGDIHSKEEEECAKQEAIYIAGLLDGMVLAELLAGYRKGETRCSKGNGLSPEA
jgi:hypothetical protein